MDRTDPAYRGQADYSRLLLDLYDPIVIGPVARYVWRCSTERLVEGYRRHIRDGHLDVGPGTGYFVDRSGLADGSRVTLLDPNPTVLTHAARRLQRLEVATVEADVLRPLPLAAPFRSAALHLVIHCLPGPIERKARAVANVAAVLEPDGVLFGASVLGLDGPQTRVSRAVLRAFNRRGAFDNLADTEAALRTMLETSFERVEIGLNGSIAMFAATGPRAGGPIPNASHAGTLDA
jgi:SAM-dependent methyltransferase